VTLLCLQIKIENDFTSGNMPVVLSVHPDTITCLKANPKLVNGKLTSVIVDLYRPHYDLSHNYYFRCSHHIPV